MCVSSCDPQASVHLNPSECDPAKAVRNCLRTGMGPSAVDTDLNSLLRILHEASPSLANGFDLHQSAILRQ